MPLTKIERQIILDACELLEKGEAIGSCVAIWRCRRGNIIQKTSLIRKYTNFFEQFSSYWFPATEDYKSNRIMCLLFFLAADGDVG